MTELMIEAERVTREFGTVRALDEVSVQVPRGSVVGLLGHNGAGKTTLVNVLTTLLPLSSGVARVAGFDVTTQADKVRSQIGLTGQFAAVDEQLSGTDNLVLIARLLGASKREARQRADELLEVFDLTEAASRLARTYSGGMRRRLDLAASLVGRPEVIFLDEPTTGLDPISRMGMWEIVESLVADGTSVLLTTQYLEEADRLAHSITLLRKGKVVATGTSAELKAQVGERTLHLTLAGIAEADAAVTALRRVGMQPATDDSGTRLSTPARSSTALAAVVRTLDEARIEPLELSMSEPTLDDVYLALAEPGVRA